MTQKAIGPTFQAEIQAAGLAGLAFSWEPSGNIQFGPGMTTQQIAAVDAVYAAHDPAAVPVATLSQQAQALLLTGLSISMTGTLTLAATVFPTDPTTTNKIGAVITTVNTTGAFASGATSWPMKDSSGIWHTFTLSQYKAVAGAIANFASSLYLIIDGNPAITALPLASVTLAV